MNNKKRGNYLTSLRKKKNLTQLELADLLHYSDKNISKWENGKSFPNDPNILNEIANIFEVPVENIIYGEDNAIDKINSCFINKLFYKRIYIVIVFFILIISFILLFISLFYKYDNYYVAKINNKNINESLIFITLNKDYNRFRFNKLESKNKDIKLVSFYYVKNDTKYLLFETENEDIIINEYSYYLEYDFESIVNKTCYLKILYSDGSNDLIKIKFNKYLKTIFN